MKDRGESADAGFGEGLVTGLVGVRVIQTDEELMMARSVGPVLRPGLASETNIPDHTISADPQQRTARG